MRVRIEFESDSQQARVWLDDVEVSKRSQFCVLELKARDYPYFCLRLLKHDESGEPYVNAARTDAAKETLRFEDGRSSTEDAL